MTDKRQRAGWRGYLPAIVTPFTSDHSLDLKGSAVMLEWLHAEQMHGQKRLRLHEARRLMLVERLDVGSAGYRVGYQSPSQFSREYSRPYGLSPLRDVERVREPVGGDVLI